MRTRERRDRIFINYRRDDAGGFAGRLADSLSAWFGPDRVFRDVGGIGYGEDFEAAIESKLTESGALVVVIGESWARATDAEGRRRLDDPNDYVLREIAAGLKNGMPVVPVLIGNASMPDPGVLPAPLRELARRNAMTVTDERWNHDVERLAKVLAIDVLGSVAQRRLDLLRGLALALLVIAAAVPTLALCRVLPAAWPRVDWLVAAGYTPLVSAIPFIALIAAAAMILVAMPLMEPGRKRVALAAVTLAAAGTLGTFVFYAITNDRAPSEALIVNFAASTILCLVTLALIAAAGFRAK